MPTEKAYPTDELGQRDAGAARDGRIPRCTKRTWCTRDAGHEDNCEEHPRLPYERQEWDARLPDPRGWEHAARSRKR